MLKKISFKHKYYALLIFTGLFVLFVYQVVVSKTISLYTQNNTLNQHLNASSTTPEQLLAFRKKLAFMDKIIKAEPDSNEDNHDILLVTVGKFCKDNKIILKSFPEQIVSERDGFQLQTNTFTAQGRFNDLLQLIYLLEQKERTGKISSVAFYMSKDSETKRPLLLAKIYQQNIKKIK